MVRYLFYTIGDLTYQSPLVVVWVTDEMCMWSMCRVILTRKPQYLEKPCSITTLSTTNPTWTGLGNKSGLPYWQTDVYLPKPWYSLLNYVICTLAWEFTFLNLSGKQHLGHTCISDFSTVLLPCKVFLKLWLPSYQTTCYHLWEDSTLNENVRSRKMQEFLLRDAHRPQRTLFSKGMCHVKLCTLLLCWSSVSHPFCLSLKKTYRHRITASLVSVCR